MQCPSREISFALSIACKSENDSFRGYLLGGPHPVDLHSESESFGHFSYKNWKITVFVTELLFVLLGGLDVGNFAIKLARVNCFDWTDVCQKNNITIYPTIKMFRWVFVKLQCSMPLTLCAEFEGNLRVLDSEALNLFEKWYWRLKFLEIDCFHSICSILKETRFRTCNCRWNISQTEQRTRRLCQTKHFMYFCLELEVRVISLKLDQISFDSWTTRM